MQKLNMKEKKRERMYLKIVFFQTSTSLSRLLGILRYQNTRIIFPLQKRWPQTDRQTTWQSDVSEAASSSLKTKDHFTDALGKKLALDSIDPKFFFYHHYQFLQWPILRSYITARHLLVLLLLLSASMPDIHREEILYCSASFPLACMGTSLDGW